MGGKELIDAAEEGNLEEVRRELAAGLAAVVGDEDDVEALHTMTKRKTNTSVEERITAAGGGGAEDEDVADESEASANSL